MEKNNGKVIAVVALVVAVVALSVGFAAFADQLTISGTAKVNGSSAFDDATNGLAYLSTSPECHDTTTPTTVINTSPYGAGTATGDTWSGINVPLSTEHPSVTCTATVENKSAYAAHLTGLATTTGVQCNGGSGTNATTNANNVCAATQVTVSIGSDSINFGTSGASLSGTPSTTLAAESGTATVTVVIALQNPSTVYADDDVTVTIPTITHSYSS